MIAALARVAAFIGVPPAFVYLVVYGAIFATIGGSYGLVYFKGRAAAKEECQTAQLKSIINEQADTIARYRKAVEETEAQAAEEIREAKERERLITERMKAEESDDAMLEAALAAAVTDKEKLNVALKNLRAKCTATNRDVDLDKRLRGK